MIIIVSRSQTDIRFFLSFILYNNFLPPVMLYVFPVPQKTTCRLDKCLFYYESARSVLPHCLCYSGVKTERNIYTAVQYVAFSWSLRWQFILIIHFWKWTTLTECLSLTTAALDMQGTGRSIWSNSGSRV